MMPARVPLLSLVLGLVVLAGCAPSTAAPAKAPPAAATAAPAAAPGATAPTAAEGPPDHLTLAITSPVAAFWPVLIAQKEGYFRRERLDVDVVYTQSGVRSIQGLAGGSYDLAIAGSDAVVVANSKGARLLLISGGQHATGYSMLAQPEIQSVAQLKGKSVGASGLKGGNAIVMRRLLEQAGLEPERDYSYVVVGATPEAMAALRARAVDAILALQPQDFQLEDEGFRRITGADAVLPKYEFVAVAARAEWLSANRGVAVRFLRALVAAERWFYDPANRARAVDALVDASKVEPRYAERTYDRFVAEGTIIPRAGELDDDALAAVNAGLIQDGDITAAPSRAEYRDDSFLAEALR
jgi:ABC-type nitrate/sulfonate/bicarbonate transport system substrate-binding protein